jgi:hypothetical protein
MNEDAKIVNYELAYRMLVLMCAATVERNGGVQVGGPPHLFLSLRAS